MLERLIRLRPSLIVLVYRNNLGPEESKYNSKYNRLFQIALDNGYKITENDLKRNKDFCKSEFVMKKAIEINPNYIRYYEGYNSSLVNEAVDKGYIPNITDLENNNLLGSSNIINYLISHGHPEAIKYARSEYEINIDQALKEYTPTFEDLKNNNSLGNIEQIMSIILEEDVNAIRLIGHSMSKDEKERLIKYAVENGFKPSVEDVVKDGMENPLSGSDIIFEKLLKENPDNIKYYKGSNQDIFKMALDLGYNPNINDLKTNSNLYWSDDIMSELIKNDPSLILEYKRTNEKVAILSYNLGFKEDKILENINNISDDHIFFYSGFIMEKLVVLEPNIIEKYKGKINQKTLNIFKTAFNSGYKPSKDFCERYSLYEDIFGLIITVDPSLIDYYKGDIERVYESAVKNGYLLSDEDINKITSSSTDSPWGLNDNLYLLRPIIPLAIERQPELIKYYDGNDRDTYISALKSGFLPTEESIKEHYTIQRDLEIMALIVKLNPDYVKYFEGDMTLLKIMTSDYVPTIEEVKSNYHINSNFQVMKKLIEIDYKYVECMNIKEEKGIELCEMAMDIHQDFTPSLKLVDDLNLYNSYKIMTSLLKQDVNIISKYKGTNIDVFKFAIENGYKIGEKRDNPEELTNNIIIQMILDNNFDLLDNIEHNYEFSRLFTVAIQLGYIPKLEIIDKYLYNMMDENSIKKMIDNSEASKCIEFMFNSYVSEDIKEYILKSKNIVIPEDYLDLLKEYTADRVVFINNYPKFNNFLSDLEIDENKFVQYNISSNYNWLSDILSIIDSGKKEEFKTVKEYFFKSYYLKNIDNISDALQMKAFITILKNYVRYPELCLNIIENNTPLQGELSEKLDFLFESNDSFDGNNRPKTIDELENIDEKISNRYLSELENIDTRNIEEVKDVICRLLFNNDLYFIQNQLRIYGDTIELRQLMFDNRENEGLCDLISEMMIYTSMMESIVEADDKEYLIDMAKKMINNLKLSSKCMMLFTTFDEKMRELYSEELSSSLTALRDDISLDSLIDKTMSSECGVEVLDFSDKQYCLLGHVKSYKETIEEVVLGKSTVSHHTICLSALSHRNQVYYQYGEGDIVFGYDNIPAGSFIQSSTGNMGSNGSVKNSLEIEGLSHRTQRGTLKMSEAPTTHNSEIHCFREGIIPKYIILPGGRKPTEEEVSIAKKYGLKFAKTQNISEEIDNPKKIEDSLLEHDKTNTERIDIETIKGVRDSLTTPSHGPRKIALFTDSHALFEPTLAILEDAKKSGITEIYSLGDNIGTGPNPREVMELLDEYGVESLTGNHEIYAALGIDDPRVKEHLEHASEHATEEARRNSTWTRAQLTPEQIEKIKNNPEQRVIEIGGQKVLLTHYAYDYNTGHRLQIPDGITHTFQGHRHFRSEDSDTTTLRGAGIGLHQEDSPTAFYIVLVEKPEGGFDIEKRIIQYDNKSLRYDIKASDMSSDDKEKIEGWVKK